MIVVTWAVVHRVVVRLIVVRRRKRSRQNVADAVKSVRDGSGCSAVMDDVVTDAVIIVDDGRGMIVAVTMRRRVIRVISGSVVTVVVGVVVVEQVMQFVYRLRRHDPEPDAEVRRDEVHHAEPREDPSLVDDRLRTSGTNRF